MSKDGKDFYRVKTYRKLTAYGKDADKNAKPFYIKEEKKQFYPAKFDLRGVEARYIGLNITSEDWIWWADEWEIIGDDSHSKSGRNVYTGSNRFRFNVNGEISPSDSVYFGPIKDILAISTNILTPNIFHTGDYRQKEMQKPLKYIIELPADIEIIRTSLLKEHSVSSEDIKVKGKAYKRHTIVVNMTANNVPPGSDVTLHEMSENRILSSFASTPGYALGPFYLKTSKTHNGNDSAYFYCESDGKKFTPVTVPIRTIKIPEVPKFDVAPISIAWMDEWFAWDWPDFHKAYRHIGFNTVPTFPRNFRLENGQLPQKEKEFIQQSKMAGFNIVYNESALHVMVNKLTEDDKKEALCKAEGAPNPLCPSYDGELYKKEVERVAKLASLVDPDYVYFDIELWPGVTDVMKNCSRCKESIEKSGLTQEQYFKNCGARYMRDFYNAVDGKNRKAVGNFALSAGLAEGYKTMFDFEMLYPNHVNIAMPYWYTGGLMDDLHRDASFQAKCLKQPWKHVNWLTAGTWGEFASYKLEQAVYEQILNGGGIGFFWSVDFETPMDFYYMAKALKALSPYQKLLRDGAPKVDFTGSNSRLYYTAFVGDKEALVLVGNYTSDKVEKTSIEMPISGPALARDVFTGRESTVGHSVEISLKPQTVSLLHIAVNRTH